MDSPQVTPISSFQNTPIPEYQPPSAKKSKRKLVFGIVSLALIASISTIMFVFLRNRSTEDRSQAALETTTPTVTSGKEGCYSTVVEQNALLFWQDSCQGRPATDVIALPTSTNTATLNLIESTTKVQQATALTSGAMITPTGAEKYTLAINAPTNAQSVSMELNGVLHRIDSERPFTLTREETTGYLPLSQLKSLTAGANFLKLTYFPQKDASGSAIKQESIVFSQQTRGTDRACTKVTMPLFTSEQAKYKQWVASGKPLQAGCPAPIAPIVSTTALPILGCSSVCVSDSECNGSLVTLVNKKPAGIATASVIESIIVNGVTIEEDSKELSYRGTWTPYVSSTFHNGKAIMFSTAADSSISFYATGPYVTITTDTGTNRIGFDVYVDGVKQANTGLENLTIAGNGNANDLSNYKLKTVALGLPTKPSVYACSDISGKKMCRIKNNPSDANCIVPAGTNVSITPAPPSVATSPLCNVSCTSEATCDGAKVYLVPKYLNATAMYAVLDKITVGSTVLEEDSPELTYFNAWLSYGPAAGYGDGATKIRYAAGIPNGTATWVSFTVNGPSFTVKTDKGPNRGGFTVYIDGVLVPTALDNLYSAGATYPGFEATIPVPGYDANKLTCATVGTGKACRLTAKQSSTSCTP